MLMLNKDREELEDILRHNDEIMEQEHIHIAQNTIEISSDSLSLLSSDESLET